MAARAAAVVDAALDGAGGGGGPGAPIATLGVYLLSVGGNIAEFVMSPPRLWGFLWLAGSGLVFGLLLALGASVRERLAQARAQALEFELERSRLEKQAVDARLSLLQAQIEPHFLFNTLANVQALVETGSPRAADVLKSLIAYLRAAMPRLHDQQATLADELALVGAYLELMRMRMPDRLDFALAVPPNCTGAWFPADGLVDAGGERRQARHRPAGIDPLRAPGLGLANLRERLAAGFGPGAELQIEERQPRGVRASIVVVAP
jgi:sensor histidine kinase YesM